MDQPSHLPMQVGHLLFQTVEMDRDAAKVFCFGCNTHKVVAPFTRYRQGALTWASTFTNQPFTCGCNRDTPYSDRLEVAPHPNHESFYYRLRFVKSAIARNPVKSTVSPLGTVYTKIGNLTRLLEHPSDVYTEASLAELFKQTDLNKVDYERRVKHIGRNPSRYTQIMYAIKYHANLFTRLVGLPMFFNYNHNTCKLYEVDVDRSPSFVVIITASHLTELGMTQYFKKNNYISASAHNHLFPTVMRYLLNCVAYAYKFQWDVFVTPIEDPSDHHEPADEDCLLECVAVNEHGAFDWIADQLEMEPTPANALFPDTSAIEVVRSSLAVRSHTTEFMKHRPGLSGVFVNTAPYDDLSNGVVIRLDYERV